MSLLFWYVGLIPDLATLRDRSTSRVSHGSSTASWPWAGAAPRGTGTAMRRPICCSPGLATPLVVSVHTVVSFDFAVAHRARAGIRRFFRRTSWRARSFPGFAMVLTLAIPIRALYGLQDFITLRHLDNMAKIMLATGLMVRYGYMMEAFMSWYSGNEFEQYVHAQSHVRTLCTVVLGC